MILEWILSSVFLILAVLAIRALLGRRIGAGLRYALWLAVLARLLVPVPLFTSTVVGMPVPEMPTLLSRVPADSFTLPEDAAPPEVVPAIPDPGALPPDVTVTVDPDAVIWESPVRVTLRPGEVLGIFWVMGSAAAAAVLLCSNGWFYLRLRRSRKRLEMDCRLPVYVAAGLPSPCLFGLPRPAVYVTPEAASDPAMLRHVLAHELTHARHLDHLWGVLRAAALVVHWWNPLVWLAAALSRRDGELACDQGALERLGDGERRAYGETLLALVTAKSGPGDLLRCATTMTGGKKSLQERVRLIAHRQKKLLGAMVLAVAVLALVALCAFGRREPAEDAGDSQDEQTNAPLTMSAGGDWRDAQITVDENGCPRIRYADDQDWVPLGGPIAPPVEWREDGPDNLAGRAEATALTFSPEVWAGLVSPTDGWLVACYGHGVASADIYVYKTADGGETWNEVTKPCNTVTEKDVHTWHVSTAGFVSPDMMIVACRLSDGAPCFITRDGGETWEQVELPEDYVQVQSIQADLDTGAVTMRIGHEGQETRFFMTSHNQGETWQILAPTAPPLTADLNRDGISEVVQAFSDQTETRLTVEQDGQVLWTGEANTAHAGWDAYFLCRQNGEEYLLEFNPDVSTGIGLYQYRLFRMDSGGGEEVVQENSVLFDFMFSQDFRDMHRFEPAEMAALVEEVNALLADSTELVNTSGILQSAFEWTGEQRFTSAPLCDGDGFTWDDTRSELENLLAYRSFASAQEAVPPGGLEQAAPLLDLREGETVLAWASGDLNGDGREDLAVAVQRAEEREDGGQVRELAVLWGAGDGYAAGPSNTNLLRGSRGGYKGGPAAVSLSIGDGTLRVLEDCDWWCVDLTFSCARQPDTPVLTQARYYYVELAAGEGQDIYTAMEDRYDLTDGTYSLRWYQGAEGAFWSDPAAEGKLLCSYQHKTVPLWALADIPAPWSGNADWDPLAGFPPLPPLPETSLSPDRWRIWEQSMPLEYTPKEMLDTVKEALYPDAAQVSYRWTDEMRKNWSELVGAEMPDYFYRDGDTTLSYAGLLYETGDGGMRFYRHAIAVRDGEGLHFINIRDELAQEDIPINAH